MGKAVKKGPYKVTDKVGMPRVISFFSGELCSYNTSNLDWLKLLPLERKHLLHGACHFPFIPGPRSGLKAHGYRIRASVNVEMEPPFRYVHWGRIPSRKSKQGWLSGEQTFRFRDLEECAVHTLAHECFHFLSASQQIREKNTEANANWWADMWLTKFRAQFEETC